ncbi:MAG TPA: hypothetical protein VJ718_06750, partial [Candidatus Binataceae bacterium]|nr:hypothetical protein [Candidatus Binataceae bacterium]
VAFPDEVENSRRGMRRFSRLARHPRLMRLMIRLGAIAMRPFVRDGYLRWVPGPFRGWTSGRDFPALRARR